MKDGDARYHYGVDSAVVSKRAQHDILVLDMVRNGSRTHGARLRVASDAKIRNSLDTQQEASYDAISKAYNIIISGLGLHATDYSTERGISLSSGIEDGGLLMAKYWTWRDLCRDRHVSSRMAIDIIIFGKTLRQCDKDHSKCTGTSAKNLIKCLDLWPQVPAAERAIPSESIGFFERMKKIWDKKP